MAVRELNILGWNKSDKSIKYDRFAPGSSTGLRKRITKTLKGVEFTANQHDNGQLSFVIAELGDLSRTRTRNVSVLKQVTLNLQELRSLQHFIRTYLPLSVLIRNYKASRTKNTHTSRYRWFDESKQRNVVNSIVTKNLKRFDFDLVSLRPGSTTIKLFFQGSDGPILKRTEAESLLYFIDRLELF